MLIALIIVTALFSIKLIIDSYNLRKILIIIDRDNKEIKEKLNNLEKTDFNDNFKLLTDREKQIVKLLLAGKSYSEIASDLYISEKTVSSHCSRIYIKLGISGKNELIYLLNEKGKN